MPPEQAGVLSVLWRVTLSLVASNTVPSLLIYWLCLHCGATDPSMWSHWSSNVAPLGTQWAPLCTQCCATVHTMWRKWSLNLTLQCPHCCAIGPSYGATGHQCGATGLWIWCHYEPNVALLYPQCGANASQMRHHWAPQCGTTGPSMWRHWALNVALLCPQRSACIDACKSSLFNAIYVVRAVDNYA